MTNEESNHSFRNLRIPFLGYGLFWAWAFLSFDHSFFNYWSTETGVVSSLLFHLVSLVATLPIFGFATFGYGRTHRLLHARRFPVIMAVLMAFGTMLYSLPALSQFPLLNLAGAFLTGLTSPWLLLLWGERYGGIEVQQAVIYTALSFLGAEAIRLMVAPLPPVIISFITLLLPLCSLAALSLCREATQASFKASAGEPRQGILAPSRLNQVLPPRVLLGFLIVMFIYGGALALNSTMMESGDPIVLSLGMLAFLLVSLIILGFGLFSSKNILNLGVGYRLTLLVFAAIFIPLALLGQQNTGISAFFASIGIYSIEMISWILLSNMASTSRFPRFLVFAASYLIFHVGMAAGILVGIALSDHMLSFSVLSICALVALAGFAFTDSDTTVHFDPPNQSELGGIATKSGLVEKTVGLIAQDFGLSKREQEVLMMWATGYPVKMIEEKLFVSASTVKTHIQHIYEKCDAHNRVEVIALLEEYSVKVQERLDQT